MARRSIVILATLDTKGRAARFLADQIESLGHSAMNIDSGVFGIPGTEAQITRQQVAAAGGIPLDVLLRNPDRAVAAAVMAVGAAKLVSALATSGNAHVIVSLTARPRWRAKT